MTDEEIDTYLLFLMTSVQDADYTPYNDAGTSSCYPRSHTSDSDCRDLDERDTPHSTHTIAQRPSFVKYGWYAVQR